MTDTPQKENGFTGIANQILDELVKINMSAYQTRVLLYVFRKTYGYGKKEDWLAVSQIAKDTGIKKSHVSRTKKELIERGLVTSSGNKIAFQKDARLWRELPRQVTVTYTGQSVTYTGQKLPIQGNTIDNIQKTNNNRQYTKDIYASIENLTDEDFQEIAHKYKATIFFVRSKYDDLVNYCQSKGKKYKNYKSTLAAWVKKDAITSLNKKNERASSVYNATNI